MIWQIDPVWIMPTFQFLRIPFFEFMFEFVYSLRPFDDRKDESNVSEGANQPADESAKPLPEGGSKPGARQALFGHTASQANKGSARDHSQYDPKHRLEDWG